MKRKLLLSAFCLVGTIIIAACTDDGGGTEPTPPDPPTPDPTMPKLNYKMLAHEKLGRGVIATPMEARSVYVGWRLLAGDPDNVGFNVYRRAGDGSPVKLNDSPITASTNFVDKTLPAGENFSYWVTPVVDGNEGEASTPYPVVYNTQLKPYVSIKLADNKALEKIAMADLDGDGNMDFVAKSPSGNVDPWYLYWTPSQDTYKLQAYKSSGESLWSHDLGWAIEQGTWYSPYLVYDFNGDGKAEVVVKSGDNDSDPRDMTGIYPDYVNGQGKGIVITGPEYLSVLDGMTGTPIARTDWISRSQFWEMHAQWPYNYASRNQIVCAYLDGVNPHIVMIRGTYGLTVVRAFRLIGNDLSLVWEWDNRNLRNRTNNYWGQVAHTIVGTDVDGDGRDELILGSCVLDDDGTELWTTGFGHCDGMYIGDLMPDRLGLEIYYNMETAKPEGNGMCMVDARTGNVIWGAGFATNHVHGTGFCSDIDASQPGRECYGVETGGGEAKTPELVVMWNNKGDIIHEGILPTWSAMWDANPQREIVNGGRVYEYKVDTNVFASGISGNILAIADVIGDWREEIITSGAGELRIHSTTVLAETRHNCLLQDPIYRNYVAQASNGYYELPMTTYDIPSDSSR